MKIYVAECKDHEFYTNPAQVMRFFQEAQEDGGHQANGKDPPRSVIFSLQSSSPNSSRRTSDEHLSTRWAKKGRETTCVQVPGMGSLGDLDTVQSWSRETRQFVSITAMHGVKRIWESRGRSKVFWGVSVIVLASLMFWQVGLLLSTYLGKPTVSQVSLVMSEQGMDFPKITLCNYNPIKQSYLQSINSTGDFSPRLVQYLLLANSDAYDTITSNKTELVEDEAELQAYQEAHPDFTVDQFYEKGGFACPELLKHCSFAGRVFDCCSVSRPVLTAHGLCHYINLRGAGIEGMSAQKESSETAGLQLILDARRDEKITEESASASLANPIDAGFRFYVDEPETSTYSTSQGISVSPGDVVYTAVSLVKSSWGNCTSTWPAGYTGNNTKLKYQSKDCLTKCKARYFNENCGCSPFIYNIDGEYTSCSALQYYECLDSLVVKNGSLTEWPTCGECKSECNRWIYGTSNSYAHGFSDAAIASLRALYPEDNEEYIRANYLSVSIFFRDLSFTEYSQVAASNLTSLLSNMGGTLGLFMGMSVLTVFESIIYAAKVLWTFVSCQRRRYTAEKEREVKMTRNETERTIHCIKRLSVKNLGDLARTMKMDDDTDSFSYTRQNSWNTLTEKDSPGPFITIPMPPAP
ncbi:hypothetical protein PRIPAC_82196 [Pristionchus pacificus]|nr:hypothetical protein PRIPAC_82196 [Pristionchus pacificus]|eukprot:PDM70420.1 ion channel [Pristionchus pacificus]